VPINFGRGTRKKLQGSGYDVKWVEYPMPHSVIPEELADIRAFLGRVL
jgi:phospholipase/carboxylesterase